ncbi:hypothetical protein ACQEVI_27495 [Promicromonospora sp. CA-289599]|uniref:hypothetical protein n=1 Tax=Promicromonospora sp. CA-289599 TaxID=3240014 RepID=UPI003D8D7FF7
MSNRGPDAPCHCRFTRWSGRGYPDVFRRGGVDTGRPASSCTAATPWVWRNVVTPEKAKVAETLAEYRGQFA